MKNERSHIDGQAMDNGRFLPRWTDADKVRGGGLRRGEVMRRATRYAAVVSLFRFVFIGVNVRGKGPHDEQGEKGKEFKGVNAEFLHEANLGYQIVRQFQFISLQNLQDRPDRADQDRQS